MTTTTAAADNATTAASRVTVLGPGSMGSPIARTFVERGYRTTVWNRTVGRSALLGGVGGEYPPDLGSLRAQAALVDGMIGHREAVGVEAMRMRQAKEPMDRRIADGHGEQEISSLFELLPEEGRTAS
ncbi:NAD(P)-dependent oxidoreductase [Planomonospora sp. ID91781]|uniref:imine reductase family protein n=1 Tax=Planomonospora sp. ID91781 TaxID=2738135 RepID=UPI0018C43B87|nr:NAD(P)-binding domain-containing protein [Planomonospora sp. ID91781]MBG0823096.1 NAD(P)-dependent oxidoreductase [Planomonospora sp. ID91781]